MIVMVFDARSNERPVLHSDGVGRSLRIVLLSHRCSCMDEFRALDNVGSPNKQAYSYLSRLSHVIYMVNV